MRSLKKSIVFASASFAVSLIVGFFVYAGFYLNSMDEADWASKTQSASSFADAAEKLMNSQEEFLNTRVKWTSSRGDFELSLAQMGVAFPNYNLQTWAESEILQASLPEKMLIFVFGKEFQLQPFLQISALNTAFESSGILQKEASAHYFWADDLQIAEEKAGFYINEEALKKIIATLWKDENLRPNPNSDSLSLNLPLLQKNPRISRTDLEKHFDAVLALTDKKLILIHEDQEWNFEMKAILHWLTLKGAEPHLGVDTVILDTELLPVLSLDLEKEAAPAKIFANESGSYEFEGSARFGAKIKKDRLINDLDAWIAQASGNVQIENVQIEIQEIKPEITVSSDLFDLGVQDLLGFGYTNFAGSPQNRIHNIHVGMNLFDGFLLSPGEEFSFTTNMGPIDAAHGWKPELVIKGDKTEPEYGGGLCQVSSTLFQAALLTGLDISARKNHSYAVSYYANPYGYGLDATIYDPAPDLKFINDTPAHILIQAYVEGSHAYFVFYGTHDGRKVEMRGPVSYSYVKNNEVKVTFTDTLPPGVRQVKSNAHTGFQVDWWRTIIKADGSKSEEENFHSNYEARSMEVLEGAPAAPVTPL